MCKILCNRKICYTEKKRGSSCSSNHNRNGITSSHNTSNNRRAIQARGMQSLHCAFSCWAACCMCLGLFRFLASFLLCLALSVMRLALSFSSFVLRVRATKQRIASVDALFCCAYIQSSIPHHLIRPACFSLSKRRISSSVSVLFGPCHHRSSSSMLLCSSNLKRKRKGRAKIVFPETTAITFFAIVQYLSLSGEPCDSPLCN